VGKHLTPARSQRRLFKDCDEAVRGRRTRGLAACLVFFCMIAFYVAPVSGKKKKPVSRTVTGVVLDGSENPIVGASVELTDTVSGKKVGIYSQEDGKYLFADLNPNHDYELLARQNNLNSDVRKVSSLDDRDRIVINLRIPPPKE
jgi:hypothetical protein